MTFDIVTLASPTTGQITCDDQAARVDKVAASLYTMTLLIGIDESVFVLLVVLYNYIPRTRLRIESPTCQAQPTPPTHRLTTSPRPGILSSRPAPSAYTLFHRAPVVFQWLCRIQQQQQQQQELLPVVAVPGPQRVVDDHHSPVAANGTSVGARRPTVSGERLSLGASMRNVSRRAKQDQPGPVRCGQIRVGPNGTGPPGRTNGRHRKCTGR